MILIFNILLRHLPIPKFTVQSFKTVRTLRGLPLLNQCFVTDIYQPPLRAVNLRVNLLAKVTNFIIPGRLPVLAEFTGNRRMINKKICAICLTTDQPMLATAAWKDGELFIATSEKLPTSRVALQELLIPRITDLESKDFEVLVDETSDFITSRAGVRVRLGDTGNTGKPILVEALDVFRELDRQKAITFPSDAGGRYRMPDTILDMERNAKGETTYRIDWAQLKSEHVLSMLCSYATSFNNVASIGYVKAMYGADSFKREPDQLEPLRAIVKHTELDSYLNGPRSNLTGKGNYL